MSQSGQRSPKHVTHPQKRIARSKSIGKDVLADLKRDDVPGLAAEIAYHAIFSIPPLIILIVTVAAMINQFTGYGLADKLTQTIQDNAPDQIRQLLLDLVDKAIANVSGGVASIGVVVAAVVAIWSGSNGIATLSKAFNRAYGVTEDRSFLRVKGQAILLTVLFSILVNGAFFLLVFGGQLAEELAKRLKLGNTLQTTLDIARWPLALLFITFILALLYWAGPNIKLPWKFFTPGSIVATIAWVAAVFGFKLYLQFVDPGSAYGTLGSVVVLLFFMYITGIIFVLGAEVNANIAMLIEGETVAGQPANLEKKEGVKEMAPTGRAPLDAPDTGRPVRDKPRPERRPTGEPRREPVPAGAVSSRTSMAGKVIAFAAMGAIAVAGLARRKAVRD